MSQSPNIRPAPAPALAPLSPPPRPLAATPGASVPPPAAGTSPPAVKPTITHSSGSLSPAPAETPAAPSKIRAFAQGMGAGHHQEVWKRPTNVTGTGATHVRSFHCRMATEGLEYLDKQINEWLDSHPDYEVKNVTISVGEWSGKVKEPNLIVQVWV